MSWWCDFPGCKQRSEWHLDGTDLYFCEGHAAAAAMEDDDPFVESSDAASSEETADEGRAETARRPW